MYANGGEVRWAGKEAKEEHSVFLLPHSAGDEPELLEVRYDEGRPEAKSSMAGRRKRLISQTGGHSCMTSWLYNAI